MPEKSSYAAWEDSVGRFKDITLSGSLSFDGLTSMQLNLSPLGKDLSHRLGRKHGNDRYLVLNIPPPEKLKGQSDSTAIRQAYLDWLVNSQHRLLGRRWRVFNVKADSAKKMSTKTSKDRVFKVYLFAEDGFGFRAAHGAGERDERSSEHVPMTVESMLQWFIPFERNLDQPALKLFARINLGVSKTKRTVTFKSTQIFRSDDAYSADPQPRRIDLHRSALKRQGCPIANPASHSAVMNDGCARISQEAARQVAEQLGLDYVPPAFQGRIAGAKGMWMVDLIDSHPLGPDEETFWIEITDSQLKFEGHASDEEIPDADRVAFEVNDYVRKLLPSSFNFPLVPILKNGGVPSKAFQTILQEELQSRVDDLEASLDDMRLLRLWNEHNNSPEDRSRLFQMYGGLPKSIQERISWFVDNGFEPQHCKQLRDQLYDAIKSYCQRIEEKLDVGIGRSAYPFMIADPLCVLEENEVHLCFSTSFKDSKSGFCDTMLHDVDVSVARLPAHLPSDIQKVRAVFKPELRSYRDVVVFSSKGSRPLASKLSGGDYDGDHVWVCWEDALVEPFTNTEPPSEPSIETFGITKDTAKVKDLWALDSVTAFIRHGFDFNLKFNMLGSCSNYHEKLCYSKYAIDHPIAIEIAYLLGLLVDSAKGGFVFNDTVWADYRCGRGLPNPGMLRMPAYKARKDEQPTDHIIDHLVFKVAKGATSNVLKRFSEKFAYARESAEDLMAIYKAENERAKSDKSLNALLDRLTKDLSDLNVFWVTQCRIERKKKPLDCPQDEGQNSTVAETAAHCRRRFNELSPTTADLFPPSDRVQEWQHKHSSGQQSYWDYVKASFALAKHPNGKFAWYIAGVELGEIKAMAQGRYTYRVVRSHIYNALKVDGKFVRGEKRRQDLAAMIASVRDEDGEDDDFGSWTWADDAL